MANIKTLHYEGTISSTTPDGCAAIVQLDKAVAGKSFAVISADTEGRIKVMNGVGRLKAKTRVIGEAVNGPEALRALSVESPE